MSIHMCDARMNNIRDEVQYDITSEEHIYIFEPEDFYRVFNYLSEFLSNFRSYAKEDSEEERNSGLISARRRLRWLFENNVCKENVESVNYMPTSYCVFDNFNMYNSDKSIDARTVTVEKIYVEDRLKIKITYSQGFKSDDETVFLFKNKNSDVKYDAVDYCGKGINSIHYPYEPNKFHAWRTDEPSKVSLSYKETSRGIKLGISSCRPSEPMYYKLLNNISVTEPYAYDTFELESQSSVVNFLTE